MQRRKKLEFVPANDGSAHFEQAINVAKNTLKDSWPLGTCWWRIRDSILKTRQIPGIAKSYALGGLSGPDPRPANTNQNVACLHNKHWKAGFRSLYRLPIAACL